jgi:hypothetical protein
MIAKVNQGTLLPAWADKVDPIGRSDRAISGVGNRPIRKANAPSARPCVEPTG